MACRKPSTPASWGRVLRVPRFYMNVRRGKVLILDEEGDELLNVEAARAEALATIQEMIRLPHAYGDEREWQKNEFVITDEAGDEVLNVPFMLEAAPSE